VIGAIVLAAGLSYNTARAIVIAPRERPTWALLDLPQSIDSGPNATYDDLRIVDDLGRETPYVLDRGAYAGATKRLRTTLTVTRDPPARSTLVTLDLGTPNTCISSIRFSTTGHEFSRGISISTSDDDETWSYAGLAPTAKALPAVKRIVMAQPVVITISFAIAIVALFAVTLVTLRKQNP